MHQLFARFTWWVLLLIVGTLFVACSDNNITQPLVEPAPDRPTFVWIFSDP